MSYVVIDDAAPSHPKLLQAGDVASWLWFCGLCYCHRHKTDGFIPLSALSAVTHSHNRQRSAATLSRLKLWEEVEGGWRVHDYHDYQQTKAVIEQHVRAKRPEREPAPTPPVQIIAKQDKKEAAMLGHRPHVFCGRRFCVPKFLHAQFDQQLAGRGPEFDLLGWYQQLDERDDEPVADLFAFLREAFKAAVNDLGKRPAVDWEAFLDECPHSPRCDTAWRCDQLRQMAAIREQEA